MSRPSQRSGVMTLKTVSRAFWFGLAVSLALHAFFLVKGRFEMPRFEDAPPIEARLEPEEFKAVPEPEPQAPGAPSAAIETPPEPQPRQPALPLPVSEAAVAPNEPVIVEPAPAPPQPEPVLPLSTAKAPPQSDQPHALLTQAADNLRQLPARIEIVYELKGMVSGRQTHLWQRSGQRYSLETEGEVTGLASLFVSGKLTQKSRGRIGDLGLMPEEYEMQRFSGKREALSFNYEANTIESNRTDARRGTRTLELPLMTGAQDPLSSIYQLAMAAQDNRNGVIVAAGTKRVKGYPYRTLGVEAVRTPLGEIKALHIVRSGDSEKSATHLWLAPDPYSLPVKVTYVDEDGTEWVLEAVSIKTQ
jgi:hypothetical protein